MRQVHPGRLWSYAHHQQQLNGTSEGSFQQQIVRYLSLQLQTPHTPPGRHQTNLRRRYYRSTRAHKTGSMAGRRGDRATRIDKGKGKKIVIEQTVNIAGALEPLSSHLGTVKQRTCANCFYRSSSPTPPVSFCSYYCVSSPHPPPPPLPTSALQIVLQQDRRRAILNISYQVTHEQRAGAIMLQTMR